MKPTQQEIMDVARESGANIYTSAIVPNSIPEISFVPLKIERFAALLLERFGAGGGEPFAKVESALAYCTGFHARLIPGNRMPKVGDFLYPHPYPTDLRAERELRRMLCIMYAGGHAYMDDGEAQDNRANPPIDFMRDSPEVIQQKIQQRSLYASPEKGKQ